ncbi:MAG: glycosyltransferase family 39 protein [Bacteroidia bacterium]|nr:glycosyltransferase family 39 protein [Bacteroidia bacterium]
MRSAGAWPVGVGMVLGSIVILFQAPIRQEGRFFGWVLDDDAMISMTYARNLAKGCGLVWQCGGDKVEGYTNLGWVLYMAFWHWLGIPERWAALPIVLTGLIVLGVHVQGIYRLGRETGGEKVGVWAAWTSAVFPPFLFHHVSGLEAGFLAMLLTYYLYWALRGEQRWWIYAGVAAVGVLVRMDFLLGVIAVAIVQLWVHRRAWRRALPFVIAVGAALLVAIGLTVWRKAYYGLWTPNTYTLKVTSIPFSWRVYNGIFALLPALYVEIVFFSFALLGIFLLRKRNAIVLLLLAPMVYVLYNVYVGGDIFDRVQDRNRFLLYLFCGMFVLSAYALEKLFSRRVMKIVFVALVSHGFYGFGAKSVFLKRWERLFMPQHFWPNNNLPVLENIFPDGSTLMVSAAGILPYFYGERYKWKDYLGKTDTFVTKRLRPAICHAYRREYAYLYLPGHTHYNFVDIWRVDGVIALFGFSQDICAPSRKAIPLKVPPLLPVPALLRGCPLALPAYYPFPSPALRDSFCRNFELVDTAAFIWKRKTRD